MDRVTIYQTPDPQHNDRDGLQPMQTLQRKLSEALDYKVAVSVLPTRNPQRETSAAAQLQLLAPFGLTEVDVRKIWAEVHEACIQFS